MMTSYGTFFGALEGTLGRYSCFFPWADGDQPGYFVWALALGDIMGHSDEMELVVLRAALLRFNSWTS
jgi:hypothetical protein